MNKRKGFTLVELLVVIAIIALLMGILMPALARVRRSAQSSACMVQVKQWATVYSMYTGDYDGYFLSDYTDPPTGNPVRTNWWIVMKTYYQDDKVLACPSATKVKKTTNGIPQTGDEGGKVPYCCNLTDDGKKVSYSYNGWLGEEGGMSMAERKAEWRWQSVGRIKQPNSVPVIGDSINWPRKFPFGDTDPMKLSKMDTDASEISGISDPVHDRLFDLVLRRHGAETNPNVNWAFADFSVRPVGLKALWSLNWHMQWKQQRVIKKMTDISVWPD
ncbi:MAG TPA: type II secretion system protein, partial [Sedimentisphaerales bacterium]|nr:type II secretion system protein [Sedimentisphaerales bacterium]